MSVDELTAPELNVVFLVPIKIAESAEKTEKYEKIVQSCQRRSGAIEHHYVPIEVDDPELLTEDLRIFYESDIEYFDDTYLKLKRFCRIDLQDFTLTLVKEGKTRKVQVKPYLTIFDVGIAIYQVWLKGLKEVSKHDMIDLCFLDKVTVKERAGKTVTLLSLIKGELRKILGEKVSLEDRDLLEDHLTMLFVKDIPFKSGNLPEAFIKEYRNHIFDIISLPERYYGKSYDFHRSRTPEYLDHVMTNISVRNDFPVFVFGNRFLGIKIRTEKPDYGFDKRVIFNVVLYTNVVLQLLLIKGINNLLLNTVKQLKKVTLSKVVQLRRAIYQNLEEYINTSIQRIAIWKMAMEDASVQLGIPELYGAVKERLEMLNIYLSTAFQRQSNVLFVILNTISFFTIIFAYMDFLGQGLNLVELLVILVVGALWTAALLYYYSRYVR